MIFILFPISVRLLHRDAALRIQVPVHLLHIRLGHSPSRVLRAAALHRVMGHFPDHLEKCVLLDAVLLQGVADICQDRF